MWHLNCELLFICFCIMCPQSNVGGEVLLFLYADYTDLHFVLLVSSLCCSLFRHLIQQLCFCYLDPTPVVIVVLYCYSTSYRSFTYVYFLDLNHI